MRYLRKTFRETGEVVRTPLCAGRPRTLDSLEANVSYLFPTPTLIYKPFVSSSKGVLSDNQTFYLRNCKINSSRFVAWRFQFPRFQGRCVGGDIQEKR